MKVKRPRRKQTITKLDLWFNAYTNPANEKTFLNKTGAAKAARYKASSENAFNVIGYQNFIKLQNKIAKWAKDICLSDARLQIKLNDLLDAKETKFFQKDGIITDRANVEALETQRRTLDMAFKLRGSYAPDRLEHTGKDGGPIRTEINDLTDEELLAIASGKRNNA